MAVTLPGVEETRPLRRRFGNDEGDEGDVLSTRRDADDDGDDGDGNEVSA